MEIRVYKQVTKILRSETEEVKKDISDILEKLVLGIQLGMPHVLSLPEIHPGLFEIRVKDRAGQFRLIFIVKDAGVIYLLHAFRKKTPKMSKADRDLIIQRIKGIIDL